MQGQCLCGDVRFRLSGVIPNLYQCHCSLCRKVTGSSANAALRIAREQLAWEGGEESIAKYVSASGFKSYFCSRCGSPLPNLTAKDTAWWVPVGLLEGGEQLRVAAHLFVASKAPWDVVPHTGQPFDEMPDAEALDNMLCRGEA